MPRGTRRIIKDHVGKASNHVQNAAAQMKYAMELGDGASKECTILIPQVITMILEVDELIKAVQTRL